jgi:hypothetical protein
MKRRFSLRLLVGFTAGSVALIGVAVALASGGSFGGGTHSLVWDGQGSTSGAPNKIQCSDNTPNPGDMLFILTTDGASGQVLNSVTGVSSGTLVSDPTLHGNEFHILITGVTDLNALIGSLTANFSYAEDGQTHQTNFVLSHGCPGGKNQPSISTKQSPASGKPGDLFKDTATLSGGANYTGSGTITFTLYSAADCGGSVYTETVPGISSNGDYTTPTGYVIPSEGTYYWVASFSGDANNEAFTSGCNDEPVDVKRAPAAGPTVSKDANGSYTNTYKWTITKSVDQPQVFTAGGADVTVNYSVSVSHDDGEVSKVKVTGTIDVNNPDTGNETLDGITDEIVDGSAAHVADCTVDTSAGLTVAPGDTTYPYSCDLGNSLPSSDVFNYVKIAWSDQNVGISQKLAAGSSDFTTPLAIDFTPTNVDTCVSVSDSNPAGPQGQKVCVGDANPTTFNYPVTYSGGAGTCTSYDNTATFTTNDTGATGSASQTVKDCQGADLTVTKTAETSFKRTFTWGIDKNVDKNKVFTAGGGPATVNYAVNVHHDAGTDSNWNLHGVITVTNPNDWEDIVANVSDPTCGNATSQVTVPAGGSVDVGYGCDRPDGSSGTNTATATWDNTLYSTPSGSASGSADFSFDTPTLVDSCVVVNDTNPAGPQGQTVCVGDANPTTFPYSVTYSGGAGTCTKYPNTATFTTNDTGAHDSASQTVTDCQGADLLVSKTASGTNDRECKWTIAKSASPLTQTVDQGQPGTFTYTVKVVGTCDTVKNVKVTGTITVKNPNDWEDITLNTLTDTLPSGACNVDPGPYVVPASGSITVNYTCNSASLNDTLNTATATWNADQYSTPTGSASGTAPVAFTETLLDNCVNVTDAVDGGTPGSLGPQFCVTAAGGSKTYTYTRTFTGPSAGTTGTCVTHNNVAKYADNSTPQQTGSSSATVKLCSYGPRFTPGYWKNHLAPLGYAGCNTLPSGTSCGSNGPFASQDLTITLGVYPVNTIVKAANVFVAMSCSFSGSSNNQSQQAIGCLAGKLLAAKYDVSINKSNTCIASVVALADKFLTNPPASSVTFGGYTATSINYTGPTATSYMNITANQRSLAIALQNALDAYVNGGYCH